MDLKTDGTVAALWLDAHAAAHRRFLIAAAVALALLGLLAWQRVKYERLQGRTAALALQVSNDSARVDSTRTLALRVGVLADSLRAVQRLAVQTGDVRDSLDKALGLTRKALDVATVTVRELRTTSSGLVPVRRDTVTGALFGRFVVDSTPFHVSASVRLAPAPDSGRLDVAVRLDPLSIETRLGCSAANGSGIRAASVTVIAPKWATVALGRVEQTSDVCRSPALEPINGDGRSTWRKLVDRLGVSVGLGASLDAAGAVHVGPTALIGAKVWP